MLLYDLVRHRQPQTAPLIFAGKKRIENMLASFLREYRCQYPESRPARTHQSGSALFRETARVEMLLSTFLHGLDSV